MLFFDESIILSSIFLLIFQSGDIGVFNLFSGLIPRSLLRKKYRLKVVDTPLLCGGVVHLTCGPEGYRKTPGNGYNG